MIRGGNGRFSSPGEPESSRDPKDVFPLREEFRDCCGQGRWFVISKDPVYLGYSIRATEERTEDENGWLRVPAFNLPPSASRFPPVLSSALPALLRDAASTT